MGEVRIPQGGLRRPRPKYLPTVATLLTEDISPRYDHYGRYLYRQTGYSRRSIYPMQVGSAHVCVMDDFGFLQPVYSIAPDWRAL